MLKTMESNDDKGKTAISFGFKKKIETKVDESKLVKDGDAGEVHKDFVSVVDKESLNRKEKKKELIIPLIQQNRWRVDESSKGSDTPVNDASQLQSQAAKELIAESEQYMQKQQSNANSEFENMEVPLLLKNKVPEGYETDDRLNVALRAEQATPADYEEVPIAAFGMAMIRGMGWDPSVGIGRTFKQNTKVMETTVRPKGLGLGASAPKIKSQETKDSGEETLELKTGAYVLVQSGSHKQKYGVIQGLDVDNAQCIVKFAVGGNTASVGTYTLKVVTKKEYKNFGKDLSRLSRAHQDAELKKIQGEIKYSNGGRKYKELNTSSEVHVKKTDKKKRHQHSHQEEASRVHGKKTKKDQVKQERHSQHHLDVHKSFSNTNSLASSGNSKYKKNPDKGRAWVRPHLKVRMVSQKYKKGRFYKEKLIVEDVFDTSGQCSCRTLDGALLDDIKEEMLETVVPRSTSDAYVMITSRGRLQHDGKLGRILEKDKNSCEAYLQLIEDRDIALRVSFDDICEYAGDVESDAMF